MRSIASTRGRRSGEHEEDIVDRSGVLCKPEQRQADASYFSKQEDRVAFLIAFTRALVRTNPSRDVLYLSLRAADAEVQISEDDFVLFLKEIGETADSSAWPKGFF